MADMFLVRKVDLTPTDVINVRVASVSEIISNDIVGPCLCHGKFIRVRGRCAQFRYDPKTSRVMIVDFPELALFINDHVELVIGQDYLLYFANWHRHGCVGPVYHVNEHRFMI